MAAKSVKKSGNNSGRKPGTFTGGSDSRRGRGPKKGAPNAGRPRLEFKAWCSDLLDNPDKRQQVEEILADKSHGAFATMWKAVADRAHGKPKETLDLNVNIDAAEGLRRARMRVKGLRG